MISIKVPTENGTSRKKGALYLVPAPLDFGCSETVSLHHVLPDHTIKIASQLKYWVCENAKSTRAYLNRIHFSYPLETPIQEQIITELPRLIHKHGDHAGSQSAAPWTPKNLLQPALDGFNMGLLSEAGMPAIADPGSSIVKAAHSLGVQVVPLVGPISLLMALAASGLNGQSFAFVGYLPQEPIPRKIRIRELEGISHKTHQTQIFIEAPYRNEHLLRSLIETLKPNTHLCVASGLSLDAMSIRSQSANDWKKETWTISARMPTVFAIGL